MRYRHVIDMVRQLQPATIVEVGTWNGARAQEMLSVSPKSAYYGFDLFEDATPETDSEEKNVKAHHREAEVKARLAGYEVRLIKGNTRETLPAVAPHLPPVDFVWLDGGHSLETIRSDWESLKPRLSPGAVVLFDDYYSGPIDTTAYGCNAVVAEEMHSLFPDADPVSGGGWVQIARVYPRR